MERSAVGAEQMRLASQTIVNRLSSEDGSRGAIVQTLMAVGDALAPLGVIVVGFVAYDCKTDTVRCKLAVRNGAELTIAGTPLDDDWPVDQPPMALPWGRLQNEEFIWGLTSDTTVLVPEVRSFHEADGTRAVAYQPLRRGKQTIGWIASSLRSEMRPTPAQINFIQNLAGYIAVALEMQRLADISRDAAVERERFSAAQQRLSQLVKVNEALRSTVAAMAEQQNLDHFLGQVLASLSRLLGAVGADIWIYRAAADVIDLRMAYVDGVATNQPPASGENSFPLSYPFSAVETEQILSGGHRFEQDFLDIVASMNRDGLAWYQSKGVQSVLRVPIAVQKTVVGNIAIWKADREPFPPEQVELALALAQQAALAIHSERLAERARDVAVARERGLAAEERALDLRKANDALRRAIDRLAREPSLNAFLGFLLFEIASGLECDTAAFTTYDQGTDSLQAVGVYHDGVVTEPGPMPVSLRLPDARFMDRLLKADGFALFDVDADAELFWPGAVDWLRQRGKRLSVSFPILVDGKLYGQISLAYPTKPAFSLGQRELVQALSTQAALSIELTRLAEEAKQAAVARERELAAEHRANQLSAANKAMRRGSELIASAENETAVLGAMLSQAVEATGASGAAVMRRAGPDGKRVTLAALSQDGAALDVATLAGLPCMTELESLSLTDPVGYFQQLFDGKVSCRHCDELLASWAPESAAYHARNGHRIVWDYPFRDHSEVGGWVSLAFRDERSLDDTTLQMLAMLTSHVSLALKMGRLSILARETAVAEERNRLAGEIHDSLAQSFAGIAMQLETAEDAAQCGEESVALSSTRRARALARFGLAEARRSVLALRPVTALAGGIEAAIKSLAERSSIDGLLACSFTSTGNRRKLAVDCKFQLFRIAQEAVSNAVRHGRPSRVDISLDYGKEILTLCVADDGIGIDPDRPVDASGGLAAIRQRVIRLKGQMTIDSLPGHGTVLSVAINFSECAE